MPEISRFLGIIVTINYKEHGIPHFHVRYNEFQGVFSIQNLDLIEGKLPKRIISIILEWAFDHKDELMVNWELAMKKQPLNKIDPLV